jgi:MFS transporter, UMF1 family
MSAQEPVVAVTRRGLWGWVLFDWASQPFYTLITTFIFAPYVATVLAQDAVTGQALWGYATAAAGLVLAIIAPMLGSIADAAGARKPWIAASGAIMAMACSTLWFASPGFAYAMPLALIAFAIASVAAEIATVFNNAMMARLVPPKRLGRLSGLGWGIGYAAGLVSLAIVLSLLAADPATGLTQLGISPLFGLDPASRAGDRATGPLSALWFMIFVIPLFLFTPDTPSSGRPIRQAALIGLRRLRETWHEAKADPRLPRFLIANMIWQDALVAVFALSGIYGAGQFGWGTLELGLFGIMLTLVGTGSSLLGGRLEDRYGAQLVIGACLLILIAACLLTLSLARDHILFMVQTTPPAPGDGLYATWPERLFVGAGILIGCVAGPLQASSRSLMARLAPPDASGRYFGLFALSGKLTSFSAPLLVALATQISGTQGAAPAVLIGMFVLGLVLLSRIGKS